MSRIRTIKPSFFLHYGLFHAEQSTGLPCRLAFAGLWTCCDREGRFKWRPEELKVQILPHDTVDFARLLAELERAGYVVKYQVKDEWYGYVVTWSKHQSVPTREPNSLLPAPPIDGESQQSIAFASSEPASSKKHVTLRAEGKGGGMEGNGTETPNGVSCAEPCSPPTLRIVGTLPLNDGTIHEITEEEVAQYANLYRGIDVKQQLRSMKGWCLSNPTRLKTRGGIKRFITTWLGNEQNNAGKQGAFSNGNGTRHGKTGGNLDALAAAERFARERNQEAPSEVRGAPPSADINGYAPRLLGRP